MARASKLGHVGGSEKWLSQRLSGQAQNAPPGDAAIKFFKLKGTPVHTLTLGQRQGVCGARTDRLEKPAVAVYCCRPLLRPGSAAPMRTPYGLLRQVLPQGKPISAPMTVESVSKVAAQTIYGPRNAWDG